MSRCVYVNGRYLHYADAAVHVEDRGFQLADSVYEVFEVFDGGLVDERLHLDRLDRSLAALAMPSPMSRAALSHVLHETVRRGRIRHGMLYLQVSRGKARREFAFPRPERQPTVVCIPQSLDPVHLDALAAAGIPVKTMPDTRWQRRDIKTVMLLPACLAKEAARRDEAGEAWFLDAEGFITEGASSNAWIVKHDGEIVTRPASTDILAGITRARLKHVLAEAGLPLSERPFHVSEAESAAEAFITAATRTVMPVVAIDGKALGSGVPGPVARRLRRLYREAAAVTYRPLQAS